jgi:adenosylmethionine-8-amino-7-oxononanoate aminotransferase
MSKIFYTDNGSTSVEVALKMALQYFYNKNPMTKRVKIISFKGGYHGDTFGAMSAAGKNGFNRPFWSHLFEVFTIDPPLDLKKSLAQLRAVLTDDDPACFIFEPLILGTGGMLIYPKEHLDALLKLCKKHAVITIADEIMTGFGRTSTLFATDTLKNKPDIICLSKGLTGGFLPLGVTACKEFIYNAFLSDSKEQAFLHGHSFTANPIACRAALASLELLLTKKCFNQRKRIEKLHAQFCLENRSHPKLKRLESIGTILVVEYKSTQNGQGKYFDPLSDTLYSYFLDHEILVRPLGNVLYLMPPYCITSFDLKHIYKHILYTLETLL